MNIEEIDDLVKEGIFTTTDRAKFLENLTVRDDGTLIGVMTNDKDLIVKHGYKKVPSEKEPLWKYVYENIYPTLGAEYHFPIFYKYGMTVGGIADGWYWFTSDKITDYARQEGHVPIDEAPEADLWQLIALCERYWRIQYMRWYHDAEKKREVNKE